MLERQPMSVVVYIGKSWIRNPDSESTVNIATIVHQLSQERRENMVFMNGKIQSRVHGSRRCTHGGSGLLNPECIAKSKNIVKHNDFKALCQNKTQNNTAHGSNPIGSCNFRKATIGRGVQKMIMEGSTNVC